MSEVREYTKPYIGVGYLGLLLASFILLISVPSLWVDIDLKKGNASKMHAGNSQNVKLQVKFSRNYASSQIQTLELVK